MGCKRIVREGIIGALFRRLNRSVCETRPLFRRRGVISAAVLITLSSWASLSRREANRASSARLLRLS